MSLVSIGFPPGGGGGVVKKTPFQDFFRGLKNDNPQTVQKGMSEISRKTCDTLSLFWLNLLKIIFKVLCGADS